MKHLMMKLLEQRKESKNPKRTETKPKEMNETSDEEMNEASAVPDLPKDLLMLIINKIFSIPDLFAFAAASRSSQTLVSETLVAANLSKYCSFPPLLLQPGYCRLRTVTDKSRFYMSRLPEKTVQLRGLGCYHGHLVTLDDRRRLVLTSVFTGKEIISNEIEFDIRVSRYLASSYLKNFSLLTAPPTSSACVFLWLIGGKIVHWRPAIEDSDVIISHVWPAIYGNMTSMAVLKGKLYCIDRCFPARLVEFDPHSNAHWEAKIRSADNNRFPLHSSDRDADDFYLLGCGEELLLVQCIRGRHCVLSTIKLYRFDFSKSLWVEAQGLPDWCLFIDFASGCPVACYNPQRWGGRDNCAYIAGPGCITWIVLPLDRSVQGDSIGKINMCGSRSSWPSPIWVYPNVPFLT